MIGSALSTRLRDAGHRVRPLVRRPSDDPDAVSWDPNGETIDADALEGVDVIVHLAGEGIADQRWSAAQKGVLRSSRTKGTGLIARTAASLSSKPALLSGSAIGYYGDTGDRLTGESGPAGRDFLADLCIDWEAAASPAVEAGNRVAFLRTGIVLSTKGGALQRQLPFFKLGLGGRSGSGRQYLSWITLDDEVRAIEWLAGADVEGPVNLVAPSPVTNSDFARTLGHVVHRPTTVIPMIGPRLLVGRELADSLLLVSQRIDDGVLGASAFEFEFPTLDGALHHLIA